MKFYAQKVQSRFFVFSLFLIVSAMGFSIYKFWANGGINPENIQSLYSADIVISNFKKNNLNREIEAKINNGNISAASQVFGSIEKAVTSLGPYTRPELKEKLEFEVKETRRDLNKLLSVPSISNILSVIIEKGNDLEKFVVKNQWRTLTAKTRRMNAEMLPERARGPKSFTYRKISKLHSMIKSSLNSMHRVTMNSVLPRDKKELIVTKLQIFNAELKLLNNYLKALKRFRGSFATYRKTFDVWYKDVAPIITLEKISHVNQSRNFFIYQFAIVAAAIFLVIGMFVWGRKLNARLQGEVESLLLHSIKDGLLPFKNNLSFKMSEDGARNFEKLREYVHRRISFGSVFKESSPFSAIVLDSNLNVIWGNNLFYETWGLEQFNADDENISWDYLHQMTNIGENDPVISALEEQVAGIYQIKINKQVDTMSYEMYVSPVEYAGQRRVMIFFYPLKSLEQTIAYQANSIITPIKNAIDAFQKGEYNASYQLKTESDFEIAGIKDFNQEFSSWMMGLKGQISEYNTELENLEEKYLDSIKSLEDIRQSSLQQKENHRDCVNRIETLKTNIIDQVDIRNQVEQSLEQAVGLCKGMLNTQSETVAHAQVLETTLDENSGSVKFIGEVKKELKEIKEQLNEYRLNIARNLDRAIVRFRTERDALSFEKRVLEVKEEIKNFEVLFRNFNKVMTGMDVHISKIEMTIDHNNDFDFNEFQTLHHSFKSELELIRGSMNKLVNNAEEMDAQIIGTMKDFFELFIKGKQSLSTIEAISSSAHLKEIKTVVSEPVNREGPIANQ